MKRSRGKFIVKVICQKSRSNLEYFYIEQQSTDLNQTLFTVIICKRSSFKGNWAYVKAKGYLYPPFGALVNILFMIGDLNPK